MTEQQEEISAARQDFAGYISPPEWEEKSGAVSFGPETEGLTPPPDCAVPPFSHIDPPK